MIHLSNYILEKLHISKELDSSSTLVERILEISKYSEHNWVRELVEEWVKSNNVTDVDYYCNYDFKKRKVQFNLTDVNVEYNNEKCKDLEEQLENEDKDHTLYSITKRKIAGKAIAPKDYLRKSENILLFSRYNTGNGRFDWQQGDFKLYIVKHGSLK